jgi:hypothetical protein
MAKKTKRSSTWVQIEARSGETAIVRCPLDLAAFPVGLSGDMRNAAGVMAETLLLQTRKIDLADKIVEAAEDGDTDRAWTLIEMYKKLPRV